MFCFLLLENGGESEIRTHGGLAPSAVFKTAALNHSATHPDGPSITGSRAAVEMGDTGQALAAGRPPPANPYFAGGPIGTLFTSTVGPRLVHTPLPISSVLPSSVS